MDKEKNKNRTDLLAAGRKKLQQFRQKKDSKGSGHGKSSTKSGKSDQHDADVDATASAVKPAAMLLDSEGKVKSSHEVSVPHSMENLVASDTDVAIVDPLSLPISPKKVVGETGAVCINELLPENSGVVESVVNIPLSKEGAGTQLANTNVISNASSGSFEMAVTEGKPIHADGSVPLDMLTQPFAVDDSEGVATAAELLHVDGEAQEADHLGSDQFDKSGGIEPKGDGRPAVYVLGNSRDVVAGTAADQTGVIEVDREPQSTEVVDVPAAAVAIGNACEHPVSAMATLEADGSKNVRHEVTDQQRGEIAAECSKGEKFEMQSGSDISEYYQKLGVQADTEDSLADDGYEQQKLPDKSILSEVSNRERPPESTTDSLSGQRRASSVVDLSSISLSQLVELLRGLDEDKFRFLLNSRESAANAELGHAGSLTVSNYAFDAVERYKEQLYLTNITKDLFHLQFFEECELQTEFDHQRYQLVDEISVLSSSLSEVQEKNKNLAEELAHCKSEIEDVSAGRVDLQNQYDSARMEIEAFSVRANELQIELEKSRGDLAELSVELTDCKGLVADLQTENENLNVSLASVKQENLTLKEEKEYLVHENGKLSLELADNKDLVAASQIESANLNDRLGLTIKERNKLEEEKEHFICENRKLLTELADDRGLVNSLQIENVNLTEKLSLVVEERDKLREGQENHILEKERLSIELIVQMELLSIEHADHRQLELELEEMKLRLKQLTEENAVLNCSHEKHKAELIREIDNRQMHLLSLREEVGNQFENPDALSRGHENGTGGEYSLQISGRKDDEVYACVLEQPLSDGLSEGLLPKQLKLEFYDDLFGFVALKGHLMEAEKIIQKLDVAIEQMHSHSASLSRPGGRVVVHGVSKLIQAFESKAQIDEHETQEMPSTEDQSSADPFLTKEHIGNLRAILKKLVLDADNASELFKGERDSRGVANVAFKELKDQHEAFKEQTCNFEARNIELEVLYEAMKQHVSHIERKTSELEVLYETVKQQDISLNSENSELCEKLSGCQSRINELQSQLNKIQRSSDEMASAIYYQLETLQKEIVDRSSLLEQEWNSTVAQIAETVGKLDASVGRFSDTNISSGTQDGFEIIACVAASVSAAIQVIENLQAKLEATSADLEVSRILNEEMNKKYYDLYGRSDLAIGILHQIHGKLQKLVNDYGGYVKGSEMNTQNEKLIDPLFLSNYETLMEQLSNFLGEKMLLESNNDKLNLELMNKTKDIEELNKRCVDLSFTSKLVEEIGDIVKLENRGANSDELPVSHLESLVYSLVKKYKEADEQVRLCRRELESKVIELSELEGKTHEMYSLNLQQENEILVLKESLSQAEEALIIVRSELQQKVTELEQSEHRVSSVREKLSIAVAKGKGLIVQRDSLKQSLAETSGELERCSEELKLKDSRLHEAETKLKTYSEAGERVEALESELSYIRNSATALRESFLLKDSVLQRIEEVLEDLDLPENFHSRDIIEKVDWLARSATGNSLPPTDWDQKSAGGGGSYSDAGFVVTETWKEDVQSSSNMGDDFRRKYDELQSKFYELAEQNEMLEQSLMERNNLVQRWEEVLDRIDMPSHLRSVEPEDRIEWLGSAFSEVHHLTDMLQRKIDNLENYCGSLAADLEESQRRISDLELALQGVIHEKEHVSGRFENLICDNEKVSERAVQLELENDKLHTELTVLQEKLVEKIGNEDRIRHVEAVIKRLQDLIIDALQDPITGDVVSDDIGTDFLERLLKKLIENYATLSSIKPDLRNAVNGDTSEHEDATLVEQKSRDALYAEEQEAVLKKELEEALGTLVQVKEERDGYMEKHNSLICEIEVLGKKKVELQELLAQEEQKSASVREKLNVAVRKGKSLVQQRESLKQTIEELDTVVNHLKAEINHQKNALTEYEKKIKDWCTYPERVELLDADNQFLRNRLSETEHYLHEKDHILSMITNALDDIDIGNGVNINDPLEKVEHFGKFCHDLHATVASSENELRKSRRAAELLLAELNEVQERNDSLQEELAKAGSELSELSRERDLAEAAKLEALSRVEQLSIVRSEDRKNLFSQFLVVKSNVDQLRKGFFDINNMLADVPKDLELLHNLEAAMESCLQPSGAAELVDLPFVSAPAGIISTNSENKDNFLATDLSDLKTKDHFSDNEIYAFVENHLEEFTSEIGVLREKLYGHFISFNEEAKRLAKVMGLIQREMSSQKESADFMKRDITRLESIEKQKDSEIFIMKRNIALLHEACSSSILEIKDKKAQLLGQSLAAGNLGLDMKLANPDRGNLLTGQTPMDPEENIRALADRLLSAVKDFASMQNEIVEGSQKEMKVTISNLQRELQEKDIQKDRICMELVTQIKEAEASATSYAADLQSAETRMHDLKKQVEALEEERNLLEQRVKELRNGEGTLVGLQDRVKALTDVLAAKEQEIEALMQALDEEEVQMEELTKKTEKLEKVVKQKDMDLENLEASRAKAMKKLSVTVTKFDELHHLSAGLLTEVEKLQSQLQGRDTEISFLRQEVTRSTNEVLVASQMSSKRNSDEIHGLLTWLDTMISQVRVHDVNLDDKKSDQVHEYRERVQKQITSIVSELVDLRVVAQNREALLQAERNRGEKLLQRAETLESSLHEKESQLNFLKNAGDSGQATNITSEILEVEPMINKRAAPGASIAPQVRSLRKVNNDQVAIAIDTDPGSNTRLEDEDDDKVHGFKSLTTSRIVPRFTRPATDMIDGLWVSCDRALMRQPALRLGIIMYWAILHALLATFVV
ncbi:trans-Golgi network-localized SYP41-interacting protein 1 isoform X2 [Malania oleifera]|uniref:trans-Golgi network-localized SYP41-interacting protein 1 isoform X2 n=1 Tax=Malania oleifera TaxID=397392 RepID=UPI0025ADD0A1|nr:trans-Golgi network-localized SYP41-interacting protein 1 isoform X2 [Malania oleifera]